MQWLGEAKGKRDFIFAGRADEHKFQACEPMTRQGVVRAAAATCQLVHDSERPAGKPGSVRIARFSRHERFDRACGSQGQFGRSSLRAPIDSITGLIDFNTRNLGIYGIYGAGVESMVAPTWNLWSRSSPARAYHAIASRALSLARIPPCA